MASEYNLQLRATLDTSDVKRKLDDLKKQAKDASQQASPSGGSPGSIAGALNNLNQTLQRLQASIDRMALKQGMQANGTNRSGMPFMPVRGYVPTPAGSKQAPNWNKWLKSPQYAALNKTMLQAVAMSGMSAQEMQILQMRYGGFQNPNFTHNVLQANPSFIGGVGGTGYAENVAQFQRNQLNASLKMDEASKGRIKNSPLLNSMHAGKQSAMTRQQRYITKQLAMMGTGVVLGGLSDIAEASGNRGTATTLGVASSIGQGAAMGGMLGGPWGMAIGAAAGGLTAAFEELTRRVNEQTAALEEQQQRVMSGQQVDNTVHDWLQGKADNAALKKGDIKYFEDQLKAEQGFSDKLRKQLEGGEIGFGGEGATGLGGLKLTKFNLREYQKETAKLMEQKGHEDPEVIRRQNAAKLYEANVKSLMKHGNRAEQLQGIVEQLKKKQEDEKVAKETGKKNGLDAKQLLAVFNLEDQIDTLQDRLQAMKAPDMGNVNSLASQGFMISQADDEARLQMQNDYLRDIASTTREIKNLEMKKDEAVYA